MVKTVALIPARSGSKRIKSKNIRDFCGHPLIAYTIQQAKDTNYFDSIVVSTEDPKTGEIAEKYGASVIYRPQSAALDFSCDYEWMVHAKNELGLSDDIYCILRPTSPFRSISTIIWGIEMLKRQKCDSVRAIKAVSENPYKAWKYHKFEDGSGKIVPLFKLCNKIMRFIRKTYNYLFGTKQYDMPTQALPQAWIQTGGLQVGWTRNIKNGDISGENIMGVIQHDHETMDLNTENDWEYAEWLVKSGKATLPTIE